MRKIACAEYAEVFKTVCVDAAYYKFPDAKYLTGLVSQVPEDFQFAFKVTDEITIKKFPNLPRFGVRAGKPNEHFLNAELFANAFLKPCEPIRNNIGLLMFEFSRFYPTDYEHGRDFVADLDKFFGALPKGWPYAVEMRNKHWLQPDYFQCLARHGVTHVFNSWEAMPSVSEQMAIPGSLTNPALTAARFLLKPGRKYEEAVKTFQPYEPVQEPNDDARAAGAKLIEAGKAAAERKRPSSTSTTGLRATRSKPSPPCWSDQSRPSCGERFCLAANSFNNFSSDSSANRSNAWLRCMNFPPSHSKNLSGDSPKYEFNCAAISAAGCEQ